MRLYAVLPAVITLLQREGRVTYRALQRDFGFDVSLLDDVRHELIFKRLAIDEHGQGLAWTGGVYAPTQIPAPPVTEPQVQTVPVVSALPPMELASDSALSASSALSHSLTRPSGGSPTEVTGPEQAALESAPMPPDTRPFDDLSSTTKMESALADSEEIVRSTNGPSPVELAPRSTSEAERRQLTVMFCDLVGSTDLSGHLDPEDLRDVVRAYQETAAEVIERYEGHIAQYLGDGLLIYFGWPVAHEDDAQRAVYTGLGIPEAIAVLNTRLEADYGVQLAVRIGIHTGPVVVGEMGGGSRHENLALGETPNIAARLEGLAQPNTTVISAVTAQRVQRSFILEELGPHPLRGVAELVMVFRIVSPRRSDQDGDGAITSGFDALVGRDEEIGLVLRRWEQSREGLGQVVLLKGEAGIGKSSLVEGLRDYVRQAGFTRIAFRCSPYHTNSAFYPIIDHVQRALGWQPEDTAETHLEKLERGLEGTRLPLEEAVPLMASLLSVPWPEGRYPALTLSPVQQKQHIQDTLVAWLLEEAERDPMLAVWEDLHWADTSTLETLQLFVEQGPTTTLLSVLTFRPEFEPPWPMRSHVTPITLNRLERPQVEGLVTRLADGKTLPAEVVEHIVGKTDGVPLYVEELTLMLLKSELLEEEDDQYVLTGPLLTVAIPDTLQDSLMARLDQMNTAKEIAQLGSVLGREFTYEMLQAISSQDDETLQFGLAQLVTAELLYQRGRPPRAKYIFKHALIQDAAYASLLRSTRQRVHEQIAQLLEARFPEVVETQPELVAHHYTEASQHKIAITYWQQAGSQALRRFANPEAVSHLSAGLELIPTLPETSERVQKELDLQMSLGSVLMATRGSGAPEVEQAYARAQHLCQQVGQTPQLFPVLWGLWRFYFSRGQHQTGRGLGDRFLSAAQQQKDDSLLLVAHQMLGTTLFFLGEFAASHKHLEQGIALYVPQDQHELAVRYGAAPGVQCLAYASQTLWYLGYPDQALKMSHKACTLAYEVSHPYSLALALYYSVRLHINRGELNTAQEPVDSLLRVSREYNFPFWIAAGATFEGWTKAASGQFEEGICQMSKGITAWLDTGAEVGHSTFLTLLAAIQGNGGYVEKGLSTLAKTLEVISNGDESYYESETCRLQGKLLLQRDTSDVSQAENCFQKALDMARSQEAKSLELRSATSLAQLWRQQGKSQDAYEVLTPLYDWFTEGLDTADLQEAKALLEELS